MDLVPFAQAQTYQEFLQHWLATGGHRGMPLSYGEAARRVGFKSRAFLADLVGGRKPLSHKSFLLIRAALSSYPESVARLFEALVFVGEESLRPKGYSRDKCERKLLRVRERVMQLQAHEKSSAEHVNLDLLLQPNFHLCYAALGHQFPGADFVEICQRTGLPETEVQRVLDSMLSLGFAEQIEKNFRAIDAHRVIEHLSHEKVFQDFVCRWVEGLLNSVRSSPVRSDELFNVSTFSIRLSQWATLRSHLAGSIDSVVEDFEVEGGDGIACLTVTLRSPRGEE